MTDSYEGWIGEREVDGTPKSLPERVDQIMMAAHVRENLLPRQRVEFNLAKSLYAVAEDFRVFPLNVHEQLSEVNQAVVDLSKHIRKDGFNYSVMGGGTLGEVDNLEDIKDHFGILVQQLIVLSTKCGVDLEAELHKQNFSQANRLVDFGNSLERLGKPPVLGKEPAYSEYERDAHWKASAIRVEQDTTYNWIVAEDLELSDED